MGHLKIVRHFPVWGPTLKFTMETAVYYVVFGFSYILSKYKMISQFSLSCQNHVLHDSMKF